MGVRCWNIDMDLLLKFSFFVEQSSWLWHENVENLSALESISATNVVKIGPSNSVEEVEHLKNIAVWASHEAQIPSLGAFYVQHLAAAAEADGIMLGDFVLHLDLRAINENTNKGKMQS
ncbi:hypothetical protein Ahy_A05g025456 [Arachis hypogaea]|uniref:Uncharacterized protein n=1 Tax=Arachis hypogaea TaxID=3818 RepID=A0A445D8Q8_ARAHY|nr:hypothetical protein Ahy_A05g025456 [Arachis hypogaea]